MFNSLEEVDYDQEIIRQKAPSTEEDEWGEEIDEDSGEIEDETDL